jgi:DNA polymerase-3 subunit epsilon
MDGLIRWRRRKALERSGLPPAVRAWLDAPWPDPDRSWRDTSFTALDLETSGLDARRDQILAIGTVDIEEGRVRMDTAWSTLVSPSPGHVVGVPSIRIHGLLPERLLTAPRLADVLPVLISRLKGRVLVVHVADVDRPFLARAFKGAWGCGAWMPIVDTARLAAFFDSHPHLGTGREADETPLRLLADIARGVGIPVGRQHDALADALICAQLMLALATRLEAMGMGSLGGLRRVGT